MPESEEITVELVDAGTTLSNFTRYSFNSDFLTPTDAWDVTVAADEITQKQRDSLIIGEKVRLNIAGAQQAAGYIDSVSYKQNRSAGTEIHITGRDTLSYAVDGHVDPKKIIPNGVTVAEAVQRVLEDFGFDIFLFDGEGGRNVRKGIYGPKSTKKGNITYKTQLHQTKPYPHEGAFAFASRIAKRHRLWIWATPDGEGVVMGTPDFDQAPSYSLLRTKSGRNNVVDGEVKRDGTDQPSILFASGFGASEGDFAKSSLRTAVVNPMVNVDVSKLLAAWPKVTPVSFGMPAASSARFKGVCARPMYVHDDDSHNQEQLEAYALREMSLHLRKALTATYVVQGHSSNGAVWSVDTIVNVNDEIGNLSQKMWVQGRTFTKDRGAGTMTQLHLILPGSLIF